MRKIGVTGASGCGKSTFSDFLLDGQEYSAIIRGDQYMKLAFEEYREQLTNLFGPLERWPDGHIMLKNFIMDVNKFTKTIEVISPFVEYKIRKELEALPETLEFVVIEWSHLPVLQLWNEMDYKIIVHTDEDIRFERLLLRDIPRGSTKERIRKRMINAAFPYCSNDGILIINDTNKEELKRKANQIGQLIKLGLEGEIT